MLATLVMTVVSLGTELSRETASEMPVAAALPAAVATAAVSAWPSGPLPPGVSSSDVVSAVTRLGLDADSVAAAGLVPAEAASLIEIAAEALVAFKLGLLAADSDAATARAVAFALERKVVSGTANEAQLAAWPGVKQAMEQALASRDALLDAYFNAVIASFQAGQHAAAMQIRVNVATWIELPAPYRVVSRAEPEMLALRDALAAERIAIKREQEVPASVAQLLAQVRAEPAIAAALSSWETNAPTIKATWAAQAALPPGM